MLITTSSTTPSGPTGDRARVGAVLATLALLVAGCGDDADSGNRAGSGSDSRDGRAGDAYDPTVEAFCNQVVDLQSTFDWAGTPDPPEPDEAEETAAALRDIDPPDAVTGDWEVASDTMAGFLDALAEAAPYLDDPDDLDGVEDLGDLPIDDEDVATQLAGALGALQEPDAAAALSEVNRYIEATCAVEPSA